VCVDPVLHVIGAEQAIWKKFRVTFHGSVPCQKWPVLHGRVYYRVYKYNRSLRNRFSTSIGYRVVQNVSHQAWP